MCVQKIPPGLAAPLFSHAAKPLILSCLQGHAGSAYTVQGDTSPDRAQIIIGDFCFFEGIPDHRLVQNIPHDFKSEYLFMVPPNDHWAQIIKEIYGDNAQKFTRYALKQSANGFNKDILKNYAHQIPYSYTLHMIDKPIYEKIIKNNCLKDLCSVFHDCNAYLNSGIGITALYNGMPVSGASSYVIYNGGIEIEVDTEPDHRNRGLATACAAKLILTCLNRGLYPNWDAHDLRSVSLAKKLGYVLDYKYDTYSIRIL